ncbi:hypothetical protein Zmor_002503 [Zophobas morio]|uniref:Uncharacterized protein n=1 Tax=Zophobas morio TaxID=2755281 RepID=A0AA38J5C5_9CUCU|nr:hypothetical protein Zmor_002503 [Zophobas morio]
MSSTIKAFRGISSRRRLAYNSISNGIVHAKSRSVSCCSEVFRAFSFTLSTLLRNLAFFRGTVTNAGPKLKSKFLRLPHSDKAGRRHKRRGIRGIRDL